jgi:ABC-2 type transport system ATP-binding protein
VTAPPVEARGLTKVYGDLTAADHVDLRVETGEVYGFLGPNGAGKTTCLRMLLGLIRPTSGDARLFGRDPLVEGASALDGVAGFVEAPRFYPYLTGRKNLELVAALDGGDARSRIDGALDTVELADRAGDKVGGYSHGMRQRLGIAGALLRRPRLLLLDEPATGLDPAGMRDMRLLIRRLSGDGITVLLSSHLMDEVQELCTAVGIVRRGRMVYQGPLADLLATAAGRYRMTTSDDDRAAAACGQRRGLRDVTRRDGHVSFIAADPQAVEELSLALAADGIALRSLVPVSATLEELFFAITEGDGLADANAEPAERPTLEVA